MYILDWRLPESVLQKYVSYKCLLTALTIDFFFFSLQYKEMCLYLSMENRTHATNVVSGDRVLLKQSHWFAYPAHLFSMGFTGFSKSTGHCAVLLSLPDTRLLNMMMGKSFKGAEPRNQPPIIETVTDVTGISRLNISALVRLYLLQWNGAVSSLYKISLRFFFFFCGCCSQKCSMLLQVYLFIYLYFQTIFF